MGKTDKQKVACNGCVTGSVTVAQAQRGQYFCNPCQESFRRIIRNEQLLDANHRVKM